MKQLNFQNIRVQFVAEDIIRVEYSDKAFCDSATLLIPERKLISAEFSHTQDQSGMTVTVGGYVLTLPSGGKGLNGVCVHNLNGEKVFAFSNKSNSGELPLPSKTPEVFAVYDNPRIIPFGEAEDIEFSAPERAQDVYLLLCRGDAKKLRALYVELTGRCELVRLAHLGSWNSKYYAYSEKTAKALIEDYDRYGVPLDCMVIDTDWRAASDRGIGYDVDTALFPDMSAFMAYAHSKGVEIMFNDHPEPQPGAKNLLDKKEFEYRREKLQSLMATGLDIWWYDRNWVTKLISPTKRIQPEALGMYVFHNITEDYFKKHALREGVYRRPVIMANVDNINNGEYVKINSAITHRYSIQWTGDISSGADSLAQEVENMIRASDNCIAYVNADCGGHTGNPDKEWFIRWMQFGALSPIYRPHCTKDVIRYREPWLYDTETLGIVKNYIALRYRLMPVIYAAAYNNYLTGEPIFQSLAYNYPSDRKAASSLSEYMLGKNILISPIAGTKLLPVAASCYTGAVQATFYDGTELKGEPIATATYDKLDMVLSHTSPLKNVPVYNFSARFKTKVKFEKAVKLYLRSDDGAVCYVDGVKVHEDKTLHSSCNFYLTDLSGEAEHEIEIEYFQAGGEAACGLYYLPITADDAKRVYLPAGEWLNPFSGKTYRGKRVVKKRYGLSESPVFVRLGAILPLAYEAKNLAMQKWDRLVFDYYPSHAAKDEGYIYEDDGETTAYKLGERQITPYSAAYEQGRYVVKIGKADGSFSGERLVKEREIKIKLHLIYKLKIIKVLINGKESEFSVTAKASGFPFNTENGSADAKTLCVTAKKHSDEELVVEFFADNE